MTQKDFSLFTKTKYARLCFILFRITTLHDFIHLFLYSTTPSWTLKSFKSREHGYFAGDVFQDFTLRQPFQFKCLRKCINYFSFFFFEMREDEAG